jgi:4-methyl-5(b-hydroxyethyl)-thiazole monophosphate biosynthesis
MKKAFIHLAGGFEEIEALTIVDVLRRGEIPTLMVSVTGSLQVTGAHGITIVADILYEKADYSDAEILILPGGMPGAKNLNAHEGLKKHLKEFHTNDKKVAAICAAPMVLGGLGILNGLEATCFPGYEDRLTGAKLRYDPVVKAGNIITSRGPGTALDFALSIVNELKGKEQADQLAKDMLAQTW